VSGILRVQKGDERRRVDEGRQSRTESAKYSSCRAETSPVPEW
jgi:hypothetical protein